MLILSVSDIKGFSESPQPNNDRTCSVNCRKHACFGHILEMRSDIFRHLQITRFVLDAFGKVLATLILS